MTLRGRGIANKVGGAALCPNEHSIGRAGQSTVHLRRSRLLLSTVKPAFLRILDPDPEEAVVVEEIATSLNSM